MDKLSIICNAKNDLELIKVFFFIIADSSLSKRRKRVWGNSCLNFNLTKTRIHTVSHRSFIEHPGGAPSCWYIYFTTCHRLQPNSSYEAIFFVEQAEYFEAAEWKGESSDWDLPRILRLQSCVKVGQIRACFRPGMGNLSRESWINLRIRIRIRICPFSQG